MKNKIYYWAPCLNRVGTFYSAINSSISLKKYSKNKYEPIIINSCGEWDDYKILFKQNNIKVINFYNFNYLNYLPKTGFIHSRFSYLVIIFMSIIPLIKLIFKSKDDILIAHLITSLPIFLVSLLGNKIKLILRISGDPKLNFLRLFFWKFFGSKIFCITFPTKLLINKFEKLNLFDKKKIFFLPDAILNINEIRKQLRFKIDEKFKFFLAVGRLTKQKNFELLLNEFSNFLEVNRNYKLIILGKGEEKQKLLKLCKKKNISEFVVFKGQVNNVFSYMKNADLLILTSLWEDPGFVLVEAAYSNTFILSSDCPSGPAEILDNGKRGILFKNGDGESLLNSLKKFNSMNKEDIFKIKIKSKKNVKKYTIFNHYNYLIKALNQ